MLGLLLWFFSLLAGIALLGLLWKKPRQPHARARLFFQVAGTTILMVLAGGLLALSAHAELAGYRPSRLGAVIAWTAFLACGGVATAILRRKAPWITSRKLAAAVAVGSLFSLGAHAGLDWSRRSECERLVAEVGVALEGLRPSPLSESQDARPVYERALGLLGEEKDWPEWIWSPGAVERQTDDLRAFLDSKQEALSLARSARSLPGYSVEFPTPFFSLHRKETGAGPTRFFWGLTRLGKIIRLRCLLSAKEGDIEGVQDQMGWLGDLLRQMSRETRDLSIIMVQGMAEMRVGLLEESLALLGTSAYLPRVPFPAVPDAAVEAQLSRSILANIHSAIRDMARLSLGVAEPEERLFGLFEPGAGSDGPFESIFRDEILRLWRLAVLPIDLEAIRAYQARVESRPRLALEPAGPASGERLERGPVADRVIFRLEFTEKAVRRALTAERIASAGQEVQTYRARQGKYPARLLDLVPRQLGEVPVDARFGRPLEYRQLDGGALVFSVWDGESDVPLEDLDGSSDVPPAWARILRTDGHLAFFLGAAREKWRPAGEEDDGPR